MRTNHLSTNPRRPFLNCNRRLVLKRVACFLSALYLVVPDVKGDAIQPWGGATAEVSSWHEGPITEQGLNSSVGTYDSRKVRYMPNGGNYFPHDDYSGTFLTSKSSGSYANVYNSKSKMIGVRDTTSTSVGGSFGGVKEYEQVPYESYSKATWTNDSIHIQPLNGQDLPDHVKVEFEVNLDLPTYLRMSNAEGGLYGKIDLNINDKTKTFDAFDFTTDDPDSSIAKFFDGGIISSDTTKYATSQKGTGLVSLDLAVNPNGWTDPFSLSLTSYPGETFHHNSSYHLTKEITIGIKDVTTLDGKSLESEGFSISYASDQPLPTPVPEPSSWVVAFTLMTIGIGYRRYSSH